MHDIRLPRTGKDSDHVILHKVWDYKISRPSRQVPGHNAENYWLNIRVHLFLNMDNIDVEQCALYSGADLSLRSPTRHLRTADHSSRSSSATRTKDASSRQYLSFDDHHYQQLQPDLKTECHVIQQIETASAEEIRLRPRSFEVPNSRHTSWIERNPSETTESGETGNHVDLRYILPIATVVCVVAVVPLIVFAATHS